MTTSPRRARWLTFASCALLLQSTFAWQQAAALVVTFAGEDSLTGGDYRIADYGSCFSLVPQASPRGQGPEVEVGPGFFTDDDTAYDNLCSPDMVSRADWGPGGESGCTTVGTPIPRREPGIDSAVCITERGAVTTAPAAFDFRFFVTGGDHAYAWSFFEPDGDGVNETAEIIEWDGATDSPASQYNACQGTLRGATFDDEVVALDPLSGVIDIRSGGDARVAFYFLTAAAACRVQTWELSVDVRDENGNLTGEQLVSSGDIGDFARGKYLVFDLTDIPDAGVVLRLATRDAPGTATCPSVPGSRPANNSHISGIFVSGTDYCGAAVGDRLWEDLNGNDRQDCEDTNGNGILGDAGDSGLECGAGIVGAPVELLAPGDDGVCDSGDEVVIASTTTDTAGFYRFDGLDAGRYCVRFQLPANICPFGEAVFVGQGPGGTDDSDANPATGQTGNIDVLAGGIDLTWDAGIACPALLGDRFWDDTADPDGIQGDQGLEPGIPNATVNLYVCDAAGTPSASPVQTSQTDGAGLYEFLVAPGLYDVEFIVPPALVGDGYIFTLPNQGATATDSDADPATGRTGCVIALASGAQDLSWDGGAFKPNAGLGDRAWEDLNRNGLQDTGEPGIDGVTVNLLANPDGDPACASGDEIPRGSTTTNEGFYQFENLLAGDYCVELVTPDLCAFGDGPVITARNQGTDGTLDSDIDPATGRSGNIALPNNTTDLTWDAGYYCPARLGDRFWDDTENPDGIQGDQGLEPGIPDVTINLYACDAQGAPGPAPVATTSTDASGLYGFLVDPGTYDVEFVIPQALIDAGYVFTLQGQGPADGDSDADPMNGRTGCLIALISNQDDPTWDGGAFAPEAGLGDRLWEDLDRNGVQDPGEPGIDGVAVRLYANPDGDLACDTNDEELIDAEDTVGGNYLFEDLFTGDYCVEFALPTGLCGFGEPRFTLQDAGSDDTIDSDVDPATGRSGNIFLPAQVTDLSWDAGVYCAARLGDRVWEDLDRDGIQDCLDSDMDGIVGSAGDSGDECDRGIADVPVALLEPGADGLCNSGDETPIDGTLTDAAGFYLFDLLAPGAYCVEIERPAGFACTLANQEPPANPSAVDSDVAEPGTVPTLTCQTQDPIEDPITLTSGEDDRTWDAGLVTPANPAVDIEKATNGEDADDPTGPEIPLGGTATFTYAVTNPGNLPLGDLVVTDDNGTPGNGSDDFAPSFTGGDTDGDGLLDAGETWTFEATRTVTLGQYTNIATVVGNPVTEQGADLPGLPDQTDADPSNHFGSASPGIDIEKATNGQDADVPTGPEIPIGGTATFTYEVTNTGNVPLGDLQVTDDNGTPGNGSDDFAPTFTGGDADGDGLLDVGETWTFQATRVVTAGQYTNLARVTANPVDEDGGDIPNLPDQTDADPSNHFGATASLGDFVWLDTNLNGLQDDGATGVQGVTITLAGDDGSNRSTTTGPAGDYLFDDLVPGVAYTATCVRPAGLVYTPDFGQARGTGNDSNADPANDGAMGTYVLAPGEALLTVDCGLVEDSSGVADCPPNIDWEGFAKGTVITTQIPGMTVSTNEPGHPAMIFDSAYPTGGDKDLGTPNQDFGGPGIGSGGRRGQPGENSIALGKVLIISEDGDSSDPDDDASGATLIFDFAEPVEIASLSVLDIEESGGEVRAYDSAGNLIASAPLVALGDNSFQVVPLGAIGATRLAVEFAGSGAVAEILFCIEDTPPPSPAAVGNEVFEDANGNGVRDPGEAGVAGASIQISGPGGFTDSITTGLDGGYLFTGLIPGDYSLACLAPAGYVPTAIFAQGSTTDKDSNADPANGAMGTHALAAGETNLTIDCGLVQTDAQVCPPSIDWEEFAKGTVITTQIPGISVSTNEPGHPAMIFDSAAPSGGDTDLGSPNEDFGGPGKGSGGERGKPGENSIALGKVLIISEDGDSSDPDDDASGGTLIFDFAEPVRIDTLGVLDIEEGGEARAYDNAGNLIASAPLAPLGNNSFQVVPLDAVGATRLEVEFAGSGAVAEILFCIEDTPPPPPAAVGNEVFEDANGNGVRDPGEAGVAGASIRISGPGGFTDSATTGVDGAYLFSDLIPGDYDLTCLPPAGFAPTAIFDQGSTTDKDSNADPADGAMGTHGLSAGETNLTLDCGLVRTDAEVCPPSIDWDEFAKGTVITTQIPGISVSTNEPGHPPMIFDSAYPSGGDKDLGTPNQDFGGPGKGSGGERGQPGENGIALGKVLIISEDGDSSDPDDDASGGTLIFDFAEPVRIDTLGVLDIEHTGEARAYDNAGNLIASAPLLVRGNNSYQVVPLDAVGATRLEVEFAGSGAVAEILFCEDDSGSDSCGPLVQEAEDALLDGEFEIAWDHEASNGAFVRIPNGVGNNWDGSGYAQGSAAFCMHVSVPGVYRVEARIKAPNGSDDSFWVEIDDQILGGYLWDTAKASGFVDDYVSERDGADPIEVYLEAGDHSLIFSHREDGTGLDRVSLERVD